MSRREARERTAAAAAEVARLKGDVERRLEVSSLTVADAPDLTAAVAEWIDALEAEAQLEEEVAGGDWLMAMRFRELAAGLRVLNDAVGA